MRAKKPDSSDGVGGDGGGEDGNNNYNNNARKYNNYLTRCITLL